LKITLLLRCMTVCNHHQPLKDRRPSTCSSASCPLLNDFIKHPGQASAKCTRRRGAASHPRSYTNC
jgi:hypothetical protein